LLVGGGDRAGDENIISAEAQRLGVTDSIEFTGRLPHDQAIREIGRAQVCASPFFPTPILNSTSPTKLVEYMALEKPVVANDHPEQRLIVEESGAGRCTKYDEHDFAAAVADLLAQPELCTRLGQRGYRYVLQHRSYKHLADTLDRTYTSILEDRRC
jgi:glycosyltransferase involved in cell wall biosynthesis